MKAGRRSRSGRMLMEQLDYNLLFRWFVGLSRKQARRQRLLSPEHFTMEGPRIEAWAGQKSFQPKGSEDALKPPPPAAGSTPAGNDHGRKRTSETHESKTVLTQATGTAEREAAAA
jgi:hypothetical protein